MTNTEEVAKAVLEANIADFIRELEKRGHVSMQIYFEGGGDSGELEWVTVDGKEVSHGDLWELAYNLGWAFAEQVDTDWYNNDGGNIQIGINVGNKTFTANTYYYVSVTELGESTTIKLNDDGTIEREEVNNE